MLVRCAFGAKRFVQAETWTNMPDSLAVACAVLSALEVRTADGNPLRTADTTAPAFARRFEIEGLAKQIRSCFGSKDIGIAIALRRVGPRRTPKSSTTKVPLA